ncbi:hypothetical protein ILYODFUR_013333 [Ilyodon furcidens]|uniref:Uncharacterized protein n=1 Tax=Ilyodon furcidens TaxID=33524 RepID=A0ABV0UV52_9TELE
MQETANMGKEVICSDETKIYFLLLANMYNVPICGGKLTLHVSLKTPSPWRKMAVAELCCGLPFYEQGEENLSKLMGIYSVILEENLLHRGWGVGSPSSRTTTSNIHTDDGMVYIKAY